MQTTETQRHRAGRFDGDGRRSRPSESSNDRGKRITPDSQVTRLRRRIEGQAVARLGIRRAGIFSVPLCLLRKSAQKICRALLICESSRFLDCDVKPEGFKLSDMTTNRTLGVTAVEVVGPEFVVRNAVPHDVVRDFENLMADRHDGLLVTAMPLHR